MEFRLLGPFEVWDGDRSVEVTGSKRRAVLAVLVLHANEVVGTDRLIDDLWERPPRNAAAALQNHVSRLRKVLGPDVVATRAWGYVLRAEPGSIDLHRFERLLAEAEPLPARERGAKLAEALSLWRGPPLEDLAYEPALVQPVARLEEQRLATIEHRIDADLEAGRHADLVGELESLVAANPLREHLRGQLILALYRSGRQAEALEVYRETRTLLAEELGLDPSPELRELEHAILRQDPGLIPVLAPPAAAPVTAAPGRRRRVLALSVLALLGLAAGAATAVLASRHSPQPVAARGADPSVPFMTFARTHYAVVTRPTTTEAAPQLAAHEVESHHHVKATSHQTPVRPRPSKVEHTHPRSAAVVSARPRTTSKPSAKPSSTHGPPPPPPPAGPPYRISDDFSGATVDGSIWHSIIFGTGATIAQTGGQLQIELQADGQPGGQYDNLSAHYGTQCQFTGNFDARVDYVLLDWPQGSGVEVTLDAFYGDAGVGRQSTAKWGDDYVSWAPSNSGGFQTADATGSLRITRVDGIITTYVWHNGRWLSMASGRSTSSVVLGPQAQVTAADWAHQHVLVAFDNFVATAKQLDCPVGSLPPRS